MPHRAVDVTPAGFPIGRRMKIADGELHFLDEESHEIDSFIRRV